MPPAKKPKKPKAVKPVPAPSRACSPHYVDFSTYPAKLWNKLSREEQQYLFRFTANFEGAYFKKDDKDVLCTEEARQFANRQHDARRRDIFLMANRVGAKDEETLNVMIESTKSLNKHTTFDRETGHRGYQIPDINQEENSLIALCDTFLKVRKARNPNA